MLDESLQVSESENNEQQNLKKMKRKKVELIDQLEGQYEDKKAKLQGGGSEYCTANKLINLHVKATFGFMKDEL